MIVCEVEKTRAASLPRIVNETLKTPSLIWETLFFVMATGSFTTGFGPGTHEVALVSVDMNIRGHRG